MIIRLRKEFYFFSCYQLMFFNCMRRSLTFQDKAYEMEFFLNRRFELYYLNRKYLLKIFFCLIVKNLIQVFFKRYRIKLYNKVFFKQLGILRFSVLKWCKLNNIIFSSRFNLPLIKGSKKIFKSFNRANFIRRLMHKKVKRFILSNFNNIFKKRTFFFYAYNFFAKRYSFLKYNFFFTRIRTTRNNIYFTFSKGTGKTLVIMSAGKAGFTGKKKRTPLAAKKTAIRFAKKVNAFLAKIKKRRLDKSVFILKLYGSITTSLFRESLSGFREQRLPCSLIIDSKPVPHNKGIRLKKPRRV
jgi:ribosomal protein S11